MANLIRMPRAAWRRQPSGPVEVDYSVFKKKPLVNESPILAKLQRNIKPYPNGLSYQFNEASSEYNDVFFDNNFFLEGYTFIAVCYPTGTDSSYSNLFNLGISTYNRRVQLRHTSGLWYLYQNTSGTDWVFVSWTYTNNSPTVITGRWDGVNFYAYEKGVLKGSNSRGAFNLSNTPDVIRIGADVGLYNATVANTYFDGGISLFTLFDYDVGDGLAKALSENPWQLFQPRPARFILIPSSGASSYSITASLDALLQKSFSSSASLDALLQSAFAATIDLDALVQAVATGVISLDALVQATQNATVGVDALLRAAKTSTISVDALLQLTLSSALDLDALLQTGATTSLSLDALIQSGVLTTLSLDALIQATKTGAVSLDALITGASGTLATVNLDALIQALQAKTLSLDALIQGAYTSTVALDAYIALVGVRSVSMDALIQTVNTQAISLDALVQITKGISVSFDALIQQAKTGLISLDAILILATSASVWLDACVQRSLTAGVSLDAIIGASTYTVSSVKPVASMCFPPQARCW